MEEKTYKCDCCKGTFTQDWSEEEALAEKEKNFPGVALEDCAQVCDDCFKKIMEENEK